MSGGEFKFVQVPPPKVAPVDGVASTLGLCRGLRAEKSGRQYRCDSCGKMQPNDAWMVWVPDGVRRGDPAWSVTESARQNAFNGSASGWCVKCATSFPKNEAQVPGVTTVQIETSRTISAPAASPRPGFLARLKRLLGSVPSSERGKE